MSKRPKIPLWVRVADFVTVTVPYYAETAWFTVWGWRKEARYLEDQLKRRGWNPEGQWPRDRHGEGDR